MRSLTALVTRGREHSELRVLDSCILGVRRFAWELAPHFSGPILLAADRGVAVAADASLYYKSELRRKLESRGVRARGAAPAELILAAYRAWGRDCTDHLEGSFSFVLWDSVSRSLLAARDFNATRPLFHTMVEGTLVVASSIRALLAYPGCSDELDIVTIAERAALLAGSPTQTSYRAISQLRPGWSLQCGAADPVPRLWRHWKPPVFVDESESTLEEGVEQLRAILGAAVEERLTPDGPTAITLSGGHDSPAVFALASAALGHEPSSHSIQPISVSYPPGDPGREDEMIREIAEYWGAEPRWIDSQQVPAFVDLDAEAAARDDAFGHIFHRILRTEMATGRKLGARVVLDGHGGDFLFAVSTGYYADLLRVGSWIELAREWRANGGGTWGDFARSAVKPTLPANALSLISRWRSRPIHPPGFSRLPADWFRRDFVRQADLLQRELANQPPREGLGMGAYEAIWSLTSSMFMAPAASLGTIALEEGVESRSPFLDERVIRYAATRPRRERRSAGESKRLLRAAMAGLLPDHLRTQRRFKTGLMSAYFVKGCLRVVETVNANDPAPALTDLGMVDRKVLSDACRRFKETRSRSLAGRIIFTLNADAWVRTRPPATGTGTDRPSSEWRPPRRASDLSSYDRSDRTTPPAAVGN